MIDYAHAKWAEEDITAMIVYQEKMTYTVDEAAEVLNCHQQALRRAVRNGTLQDAKVGKSFTISRYDLATYYQDKGGGQLFVI